MTIKNAVFMVVLALVAAGLGGCAAPLPLQGLSSSSPVAFGYIGRGEADSCWLAHYDDVVLAVQRAGQALSLTLEKKKSGDDQTVFHYIDDYGQQLGLLVERRTATVTYARFDVGWFGSKSMGRMMARQIVFEITEAGAFLRNWHPAAAD